VVDFKFFAKMRKFGGIMAPATLLIAAHPALANSSTAADIAAPLRAAQDARQSSLGNGDEEFRQLFASWRSLDKPVAYVAPTYNPGLTGFVPLAATNFAATPFAAPRTVSIPSRIPVEGVHLTSDFGMRWHPVTGGRHAHKGVDLAGPVGTPVHATADAIVGKAEWFSSYGLYVALEHGGDIETRYGHMSRLNVYAGQHVHKGDVIGYIGTTGRSTGPHLHYEVRLSGVAVNPIPYMQSDQFSHPAEDSLPAVAFGLVASRR
jgi:murein DD-endopeptidase MepM/ murein hydrolase activator NlpD